MTDRVARHRLAALQPDPRIAELEAVARECVSAWESLPGNQRHTAHDIERWINGPMREAIKNVRAALASKEPSDD